MYVVKKQLGLGQPLEAPGLLLWERGKRFRASIELISAFQGLARCIGKQRERSAAGVEESLCFVGGQPVNRWQQGDTSQVSVLIPATCIEPHGLKSRS